jgi:hypothetical protein
MYEWRQGAGDSSEPFAGKLKAIRTHFLCHSEATQESKSLARSTGSKRPREMTPRLGALAIIEDRHPSLRRVQRV